MRYSLVIITEGQVLHKNHLEVQNKSVNFSVQVDRD